MSLQEASTKQEADGRPLKTAARIQKALFYLTLYDLPTETMSSSVRSAEPSAGSVDDPATKTTFLNLPLEIRQYIFSLSYDSQRSRLAQMQIPQSLHENIPHSRRTCVKTARSTETRFQELHLTTEIRDRAQQDHLEMAMWVRALQKTHESFDRETDFVETKWASELEVLEEKVKRELWECVDKCHNVKNWGSM
ncbi:hypothetical protein FKW77_007122 [Venturia effusa]|uniref:Uncharacterized protein n=1 Tax=Venturia effusa TaxID=50376 RepID=A0A517LJ46_9PEZI|nr:hypothetical protein FKW77_007122 [Venturia effusa]